MHMMRISLIGDFLDYIEPNWFGNKWKIMAYQKNSSNAGVICK